MEYRKLGNTGWDVSAITIGSWLTYGLTVDDGVAKQCIDAAFDAGINFVDTANVYGNGRAEEFLSGALADHARDSYYLATKLFWEVEPGSGGLSAKEIQTQCENSLRRLKVDHIDLYYAHRYDEDIPIEETMTAFTKLVDDGKVRAIGFSEWTVEQIQGALAVPNVVSFAASQPQYSIMYRAHEAEVLPLTEKENIGTAVWSPLAEGVLTGKYLPNAPVPPDSRAANTRINQWLPQYMTKPLLEAVQNLRPIASGLDLTLPQLAVAWVLQNSAVTTAIVGASKPEQVRELVGGTNVNIPNETMAEIDSIFEGLVRY